MVFSAYTSCEGYFFPLLANKVTKNNGYKKLQCKYCDRICQRVDVNATKVTCWKCTSDLVNGKVLELRK